MGNYASCTLPGPKMKNNKSARVIFPNGEIRQFRETVKAAELMLEIPNHFLANSRSLNISKRFSPLSADEELEVGNVYLMFPMKRVNSVVSAADMAVYFMAANSAAKRISGGSSNVRVLPESVGAGGEEGGGEKLLAGRNEMELEGFEALSAEYRYRLGSCRSRKPGLETIREEPVWIR